MNYKFISLIVILLSFSCKKELTPDSNQIDITTVYDQEPIKPNLSNVIKDIKYLQLENAKEGLLDVVDLSKDNIYFFEDKILINDNSNNLLLFNQQGKFITRIGSVGRGPEEYSSIYGVAVLDDEKLIAVNSTIEKKVYLYDYNGDYVKSFDTKFQCLDLFSFNNSLILYNGFVNRYSSDFNSLSVFSSEGELKTQLLNKSMELDLMKKMQKGIFWGYDSNRMKPYSINGKQFFWESGLYNGKDTIWEVTKDFKMKYNKTLFIGGEKIKLESFYKDANASNKETETMTRIKRLYETDKYMFIELEMKRHLYHIYRDKEEGKNFKIEYKNKHKKGLSFEFYNDIDGGLSFWPNGNISENKFFKLVYGYEIKKMLNRKIKSEEAYDQELYEMVKNSKIADNPILMIVTFKTRA